MPENGTAIKKYSFGRRILPYATLAILLSLSIVGWRVFVNRSVERDRRRFEEHVDIQIKDVTQRVQNFKMILQGGVGVFMASQEVTREEWRDYVDIWQVPASYPGSLGLGIVWAIHDHELDAHIQEIREQGFPGYAVWPAGEREFYVPVVFLEPFDERNRLLLGYDCFSDPVRRFAMERARDTGEVAISRKVELIQDQIEQPGFVMFAPIFPNGVPTDRIDERRAAIQGFAYAAFVVHELMQGIFPESNRKIEFGIYDGAEIAQEALLYNSRVSSGSPDDECDPMFIQRTTLDLYGHQWTLVFETTPAFEMDVNRFASQTILMGGIAINLLIFIFFKILESTERRAYSLAHKITAELRESEERFRSAMEHSPVGMALLSPEGHWLAVNVALCALLGYAREEFLQTTVQILTHADDLDGDLFHDRQMLAGEINTCRMEKRYLRKNGTPVWALSNASLIRKEDASPDYFILQIVDITEQKHAEQDRVERMAAEAASRQKSLFLSNMSHEIRTPMNAILGFAEVLERDPSLTPNQMDQVRTINHSGRHLLRLINDILDISRIEAGKTSLRTAVFCVGDLLDDLEMMFRSRADAKALHVVMDRDATMPPYVLGDEGKLRQVLVNLLGNAIKFTERGGVCVRVRCKSAAAQEEEGKSLLLVFEVEDSGPGIPESDLDRVFNAFDQSEAGARVGIGAGLGLTISRRLVEMMGGSLTVQSVVDTGCIFRFEVLCEPTEVPLKPKELELPRVVGLEPGTGPWRVLVVDDVDANRALLCSLLLPLGFELREAGNGAEAVEIFVEWLPHVVLMDMRMPVMDGYEATRLIKDTEAGHSIPIIAVTASAFEDSEEKIMALGVSAYLRKPFRPEEIYNVLGNCLGLRYVYAHEPGKTSHHPAPALTAESVAALPQQLCQDMREAVAAGDVARLGELIHRVESLNNAVALGLQALAARYDYATLIDLLGEGENANG